MKHKLSNLSSPCLGTWSTIDRFENGGLPVQLVLYQQTPFVGWYSTNGWYCTNYSSLEFLQKLCVKNAVGA